jgi:hypothetical protein
MPTDFDPGQFRQNFPEFADTGKYPDSMLTFWASVAVIYVNSTVWGEQYVNGMSLCLAHHLANANMNLKNPGDAMNLMSSKSVGDVSASFDTVSVAEKDAGHWNSTGYGMQFIHLARLIGGFGRQI